MVLTQWKTSCWIEQIRDASSIPHHIWKLELWWKWHGRSTRKGLTIQSVVLKQLFIHIGGKNKLKSLNQPYYTAISHAIAETGKQTRCSLMNNWIKKMWHRHEVKSLSRVQLFATPWTVAYQAPLSMGFPRHQYWSGLPFPSPGDLLDTGI